MRKAITLFLLSSFLLLGCAPVDPAKREPRRQAAWQIQTCEMCGAEWMVQSDKQVPPTLEWCIHDGAYCETGFAMVVARLKADERPEEDQQFFVHCLACKGCRCAAFTPERWRARNASNK